MYGLGMMHDPIPDIRLHNLFSGQTVDHHVPIIALSSPGLTVIYYVLRGVPTRHSTLRNELEHGVCLLYLAIFRPAQRSYRRNGVPRTGMSCST